MSLQELKGNYILHPFKELHKFCSESKDMTEEEYNRRVTELPLRSLSGNKKNEELRFKYLLVDFYEWLNVLTRDIEYQSYVEESDFILKNLHKYRDFQIYTSYRLTGGNRLSKVMSEYLDPVYLNDFFRMYEIFMRYMEKTQLEFLRIYKNNGTTNPVAIIPWSYGLNRLANLLYIITESDEIQPFVKLTIQANRSVYGEFVNGSSNVYNMKPYYLKENNMPRPIKQSPIKLYHYKIDKPNTDIFSKNWLDIFNSKFKVTDGTYDRKLLLVNALFSQYLFYGRHKLDDENVFYLNYPFMLPYIDAQNVVIESNLTEKASDVVQECYELDE